MIPLSNLSSKPQTSGHLKFLFLLIIHIKTVFYCENGYSLDLCGHSPGWGLHSLWVVASWTGLPLFLPLTNILYIAVMTVRVAPWCGAKPPSIAPAASLGLICLPPQQHPPFPDLHLILKKKPQNNKKNTYIWIPLKHYTLLPSMSFFCLLPWLPFTPFFTW